MKGSVAVLDQINGRPAAALIREGRLEDLLITPVDDDMPVPGAIYRARAERPVKGQNGMVLDLGAGQRGFLRQAKGIAPGETFLVQVVSRPERGKAAPVTTRLLFKGRHTILTPGARGRNVARSIRDDAERDRLQEIAHFAMEGASDDLGLILRSVASQADDAEVEAEISELRSIAEAIQADSAGAPELLLDAADAHYLAWRDWADPLPDLVADSEGAFEDYDILSHIEELMGAYVRLGDQASMYIEPTRALVAVDVNTGGDFSFSAGLKANLAAVRDLPRQLRLRGLGGQIVVDLAPMGKKDRRQVEKTLNAALRTDTVETNLVGWTPLGHLELQRKRERIPLGDLLRRS